MANFRYVDPEENTRDPFATEEGSSEFQSLLAQDASIVSTRKYRVGDAVTGKVMSVGQEFAFVDLGGKTAAAVAIDEYRQGGAGVVPKVGDEVQLYVREDNGSEVVLTRSLRRSEADDAMLRSAYEQGLPVDAKVEKAIKGGFEVSVGSKRGFVPMGAMDIISVDKPELYIGKVLKFTIQTFSGRNLVLSRKSILREEQEERKRTLLGTLEVGDRKRAVVTRIATFGAFADIGGVEGLIPMSELSWSRVKKAEDVVQTGEEVYVIITKVEHAPKLKIGLSLKAAGEDPWVTAATRLSPGDILPGKVSQLTEFGAFVTLQEGVDGLVHVSQLSWEKRVNHPREIVAEGQQVSVHVLAVDVSARKLSLSIKGPMPAELATRLDAKRRSRVDFSAEEQEQNREWEEFQKVQAKAPHREESSALAAAFARAKTRK